MIELKMPFFDKLPPLSTEEYEALRKDIDDNGLKNPIVIDEDGNILDGHHRYKALTDLGKADDFRTEVVTGLTESLKIAHVWRSNFARRNLSPDQKAEVRKQMQTVAKAMNQERMSQEAIAAALGVDQTTVSKWFTTDMNIHNGSKTDNRVKITDEVEQQIFMMLDAGVPQAQIAADAGVSQQAISKEKKKNEKNKKKEQVKSAALAAEQTLETELEPQPIIIENGQWWQLGAHKLYVGDTSTQEFIDKLPAAALAFADPPYGVSKAGWDSEFYWEHDYLIDKAKTVAVTPGIVSIFEFARLTVMPYQWSMACWVDNGMTRGAVGYGNWIYIALFSNETVYRQSQDVIRISIENNKSKDTKHESRKPAPLLTQLVSLYSKENDIVIDPFLGSGTTLFAAEEMKRACIGGEINHEYCREIIQRWNSGHKDQEAHTV